MENTKNIGLTIGDISKYYDDFYTKNDFVHFQQDLLYIKFLSCLISDRSKKVILDVGCGRGYWSNLFYINGISNVVGIDISLVGLKNARSNSPHINFVLCDARFLAFKDESFDLIFCQGLSLFNTENLEETKQLGFELIRCLKKSGYFVFASSTNLSGKLTKGWQNHKINYVKNYIYSLGCNIEGTYLFDRRIFLKIFGNMAFKSIFSKAIMPVVCSITRLPASLVCVAKKRNI